jgi:hypothetical protein
MPASLDPDAGDVGLDFLEDKAEDFIFSLTELTFYDIMILAQKSSLF